MRLLLDYISGKSDIEFTGITDCTAAQLTYAHASNFGNTDATLEGFWKKITAKLAEDKEVTVTRVESSLQFISSESRAFDEMVLDLQGYIPSNTDIHCHLYGMLGYDIGIVYRQQALINLMHPLFEKDLREIIFMSMHELHHVVYTSFNPFFEMSDIMTLSDLVEMIKYCTHLEGLGVYVPLSSRIKAGVLVHEDYAVLLDERRRLECVQEFFSIFDHLLNGANRQIRDDDWSILDLMTSGKRLWYIAGAHMAQTIDRYLGRKALNDTIRQGPENFFSLYQDLK